MKLTLEALSKLSREEKLQLIELLEEKTRRQKEAKSLYKPNSGQLPVHQSKKLVRLVTSGNGSGKTALAVHEAIWSAYGFNPVTAEMTPAPVRVIVVLDKPDKADTKWIPEIQRWFTLRPDQLHKRGKHATSQITFDNGSELIFFSHDQDPLTFESIEATGMVIFDEPPPRHIYVALRRGGREKGKKARFLIVGTPITAAWLRTEIFEPWTKGQSPDTDCFRFGTEVNKGNLADGYIDEFASVLTEKEKRIRLHGEFYDLDGLALAHLFKRDRHILRRNRYQWDDENPCVIAIDCHPSKPSYACIVGADEQGPIWLKSFKEKLPAREFARELKKWYRGYRIIDIVCDDLGNTEGSGGEGFKSFIQVMQEEGVRVRPTTYNDKRDEEWVSRIQDALLVPDEGEPKFRILEGNDGIVTDIENVEWLKIKNTEMFKPTLNIANKDWLSCLKYALACNLTVDREVARPKYVAQTVYGIEPKRPRHRIIKLRQGARNRSPQKTADDDW